MYFMDFINPFHNIYKSPEIFGSIVATLPSYISPVSIVIEIQSTSFKSLLSNESFFF